jgi:hypothetical protein
LPQNELISSTIDVGGHIFPFFGLTCVPYYWTRWSNILLLITSQCDACHIFYTVILEIYVTHVTFTKQWSAKMSQEVFIYKNFSKATAAWALNILFNAFTAASFTDTEDNNKFP